MVEYFELMKKIDINPGCTVDVQPIQSREEGPASCIAKYFNQTAEKLGIPYTVNSADIENSTEFVGERYGIPTVQGIEMIKLMERTYDGLCNPGIVKNDTA